MNKGKVEGVSRTIIWTGTVEVQRKVRNSCWMTTMRTKRKMITTKCSSRSNSNSSNNSRRLNNRDSTKMWTYSIRRNNKKKTWAFMGDKTMLGRLVNRKR